MVLMDCLANALKSINNAEKRGKRQVRKKSILIEFTYYLDIISMCFRSMF